MFKYIKVLFNYDYTITISSALFIKIVYSVNSPENKLERQQHLRIVGDKLKNSGLNEQAIDQYIKYLDTTKLDILPRASVAHTVGELYTELNNCREALVWLFSAETAGPTYQRADELAKHIDRCLTQINSPEPRNLATR